VEQFRAITKRNRSDKRDSPTPECPATQISWYDAAEYCNKLSEKENIPEEEWCYIPNKDGNYEEGMKIAPNHLRRQGYRLPTEAEWEFCFRVGSETTFSFGNAQEVLEKYGWYYRNSSNKSHPVGILKPNDLGLYDMHGNVMQWCQDDNQWCQDDNQWCQDDNDHGVGIITDNHARVLRGSSFDESLFVNPAYRQTYMASSRFSIIGFRVARTLPPPLPPLLRIPPYSKKVENKK
jgi:hypothetical protein